MYYYQYLVKYIYSASGKAFLICLHHIFPLFLKVPQYTHTHLFSTQRPAAAASSILAFAVVKVQKRKALQKGFFFLAFIGWMSAALMAVLCRLKGRGKKGQKMGGVHVFSCNYSRQCVLEVVQQQCMYYILQLEETSCKIGKKGCFFAPPIPYSLSLLRQAIFTQKKGKQILLGKYTYLFAKGI